MVKVEEGVSNFRDFQLENRDFMGWFRAQQEQREQTDKRRSKVHFGLLSLLSGLIIALFAFMLTNFDTLKHNHDGRVIDYKQQNQLPSDRN